MVAFNLRLSVLLLLGVCLLMPWAAQAQITASTAGAVQGTVLFGDANNPILVPGAKVAAYGDTIMLSTLSDREGKFPFSKLEPGVYLLEATCPHLHAEGKVRVDAGTVAQIVLQLTPRDATI